MTGGGIVEDGKEDGRNLDRVTVEGKAVSIGIDVESDGQKGERSTLASRDLPQHQPVAEALAPCDGQPESQQVALLLGFRVVFVLGSRVEHRVVRQQLDVAGRQVHVEEQVGAGGGGRRGGSPSRNPAP